MEGLKGSLFRQESWDRRTWRTEATGVVRRKGGARRGYGEVRKRLKPATFKKKGRSHSRKKNCTESFVFCDGDRKGFATLKKKRGEVRLGSVYQRGLKHDWKNEGGRALEMTESQRTSASNG